MTDRNGKMMRFLERNHRKILILLITFLFVAGLGYTYYLGNSLRYLDESDYYNIAKNLATKHIYSTNGCNPTAFRAPGYPFLLAGLMLLGASIPMMRLINFIILCLCTYLLDKLVVKHSSSIGGLVSVVMIIFYPVLFYTAGTLYPQILGGLLLILVLLLISEYESRQSPITNYFWAGLIYGYTILSIPAFLLNLPALSLAPWFFRKKNRLMASLIFFLTAIMMVGLWSVRNYTTFGRFVPLTSHSGGTLLYGNCDEARPTSYSEVASKYAKETENMNEFDRDKYYSAKAIDWIKNNKAKAAKLYLLKVINYFNYEVELNTKTQEKASRSKDIIMLFTYGTILLFTVRIIFIPKIKLDRFESYLIFLYISNAFLLAIFLVRIRLRLPFDFLLIAIVAIFLDKIMRKPDLLANRS